MNRWQSVIVVMAAFFLCNPVSAELNPDKPFAEQHVLLQVSDNDPAKFSLALDIANNLIRHYGGTDNIDVQIVTFAGGIHMLTNPRKNPNTQRIKSLMASDVSFIVCLNTLDTITRKSGSKPVLIEGSRGVQTGVAHMLEKIHSGYTVIRP